MPLCCYRLTNRLPGMQLASKIWDTKARSVYSDIIRIPFDSSWDMEPALFHPKFRQLAPHYPASLSKIGQGGQGEVT